MLKPRRDQVVAWRGPMLDRALVQMLSDVYWGDLDVLLLDLPPGTGDIAISLGQHLPNAEVVVVTTPQEAAAEVAERAGTMASMMHQRVVGVVENMSYLACPHCGSRHRSRSSAPAAAPGSPRRSRSASATTCRVLGEVPLDTRLREGGDAGTPDRRSPTPTPRPPSSSTKVATDAQRPRPRPGRHAARAAPRPAELSVGSDHVRHRLPEFLVIVVVGTVVFGPDRLPDFARQPGRMVRQVRKLSQQARDDIRTELGPEYADFELTDLDPRRAIRKHILEAWDETTTTAARRTKPRLVPLAERRAPAVRRRRDLTPIDLGLTGSRATPTECPTSRRA